MQPITLFISQTEWFEALGKKDVELFRQEDNDKRLRLEILNHVLGLPYDKPVHFQATDIARTSPAWQAFIREHGKKLCALRLVPLDPTLPKLRQRGSTIIEAEAWFYTQQIEPEKYRAEVMFHNEINLWATCFVVNHHGIFGEIIQGGHNQLTQGCYTDASPITFAYDFKTWRLDPINEEAQHHLEKVIAFLLVSDTDKRSILSRELDATFVDNFLCGYFETVESPEHGIWFIDYNRILGNAYKDFIINPMSADRSDALLTGQCGNPGIARGRVRIVAENEIGQTNLAADEILVCELTTPSYVPLMKQAAGIVTDHGGILSHAAIASRELGKPCIVGTQKATGVLHDGDEIEIDATNGIVKK